MEIDSIREIKAAKSVNRRIPKRARRSLKVHRDLAQAIVQVVGIGLARHHFKRHTVAWIDLLTEHELVVHIGAGRGR